MQTPHIFSNKLYIMYPYSIGGYSIGGYEKACFVSLLKKYSTYRLENLYLWSGLTYTYGV